MRESEGARRTKGGGNLIVGSDRAEVPGMEVVELPNKEIDVVRGEGVVLLEIIQSNERESGWKIPPKNMDGWARVLGGTNDVHYWGVKGKGRRDVNLN